MKLTKAFFFVVAVILFHSPAYSQTPTLDALVGKLFQALKTKDEAAYLKLYPTGTQLNRMLRAGIEPQLPAIRKQLAEVSDLDSSVTEARIDSILEASMSIYSDTSVMRKIHDEALTSFREAVTSGETFGIDWSSAQFVKYTIDSLNEADKLNTIRAELSGVKITKATIHFITSGKPYRVLTGKLLYLPLEKNWFGGELEKIERNKINIESDKSLNTAIKPAHKTSGKKPKAKS